MMFFSHYKLVPKRYWRWHYFTPKELASKGNGSLRIDENALDMLEQARQALGKPLVIYSAYRDEYHNAHIGGSPRSYHLEGRAFDIALAGHHKTQLITLFKDVGFTGLGVNYHHFIHIDNGTLRSW